MKDNDCFVIMPFGVQAGAHGTPVDYEMVFEQLHKPALEAAGLLPFRAKDIGGNALIDAKMIGWIADAHFALVDISGLNANVMWEFGARHALRRSTTMGVRQAGTLNLFNVTNVNFHEYTIDPSGAIVDIDMTRAYFTGEIDRYLKSEETDSPIARTLSDLDVRYTAGSRNIHETRTVRAQLRDDPEFLIGVKTGDIADIRGVDAWVNSENDYMQMARIMEKSISATIRYLGAKRDPGGGVIRDQINDHLQKAVNAAVGDQEKVDIGSVFHTAPGELGKDPYNLRRLFHVAAVEGKPRRGFQPAANTRELTKGLVAAMCAFNERLVSRPATRVRSALLPLFGTGNANRHPDLVTDLLVQGVLDGYTDARNRRARHPVREIYFLAHTTRDLQALQRTVGRLSDRLVPLRDADPAPADGGHV